MTHKEGEMPKVLPPLDGPTRDDLTKAEELVASDWPPGVIYTDIIRKEIYQVARQLWMKRKTIQ
jgi:hypothetical protein